MKYQTRQKNTAPQEKGAVLRQNYAKRIHFPVDRPTMQGYLNGSKLSVDTWMKLNALRPKQTIRATPVKTHSRHGKRELLMNYAIAKCFATLCFESNVHSKGVEADEHTRSNQESHGVWRLYHP